MKKKAIMRSRASSQAPENTYPNQYKIEAMIDEFLYKRKEERIDKIINFIRGFSLILIIFLSGLVVGSAMTESLNQKNICIH